MGDAFTNAYDDEVRAAAYASLGYYGTYYLAVRDLPDILAAHVDGGRALDFGCGAGRSTRFLQSLGYQVTGVDISARMLERAQASDPRGDYRLIAPGDLADFDEGSFDLVLAMYPFDYIPTHAEKVSQLTGLARLLRERGRLVNLVSSPEIYRNEWLSFSTRDFPENREARSGDVVRVVLLDVDDARPIEDIFWSDAQYLAVYADAGLEVLATYRPLGRAEDGIAWTTEWTVSPWVTYVLGHA